MINLWFDSPLIVAMLLVRTTAIALLLIAFLQNAAAQKRQHSIVAYEGAVATDDGRCSEIGMNVLRQGGNAIDASVAAALCLGVVSSASSGLGGGAFAVVKLADGTEVAYDSRETAPLSATEVTRFSNNVFISPLFKLCVLANVIESYTQSLLLLLM